MKAGKDVSTNTKGSGIRMSTMRRWIIVVELLIILNNLFVSTLWVYAWMYVCVLCACLELAEARGGCHTPSNRSHRQ